MSLTAHVTAAHIGTGTSPTAAVRKLIASSLDAGHLLASVLGGGGGKKLGNVAGMARKLNRGALASFEKKLANFIRPSATSPLGNAVDIELNALYSGTTNEIIELQYKVMHGTKLHAFQIFK